MPTPGLSLFGFYPSDIAVQYLAKASHLADPSPQAMLNLWTQGTQRLGEPGAHPGVPDVQPVPADCAVHVAAVNGHPLMAKFQEDFGQCEVRLIEIRPLIAAQVQVERHRCSGMHELQGATVQQLLERCLPVAPEGISVTWEQDQARHGLMEAGHTHMPCLVVHGQRSQLGVYDFPPAVLEGPNPPTVGHFSVERATELQLRRITKMIAITWTEYLVAEQD